jgi:hypothetical protein
MCGAAFENASVDASVDPPAPTWEEPAAPEKPPIAPALRQKRTMSSKTRRIAIAGSVAGVLIVALAGFTWYSNRPQDLRWQAQPTPLGLGRIEEAGTCRTFSPSADDDVAVAGQLCDIGAGRSLAVMEFDFHSRDITQVEPRFLAGSLMQGTGGVETGALDTFTPSTSSLGTVGDLTGRAVVGGQEVKFVGRIVESGNRGILMLAAAPDPGDVADAFHTMAASFALATPPKS